MPASTSSAPINGLLSPPRSYRSHSSSLSSCSTSSPTPSYSSINSNSTTSTSIRSRYTSSPNHGNRFSPYPQNPNQVKVHPESHYAQADSGADEGEEEDEVEILRDIREIELEQLRILHYRQLQKARSTSPYEHLKTAKQTNFDLADSRPPKRQINHRRAYSMSNISYGYFLFPSPSPPPKESLTNTPTPPKHEEGQYDFETNLRSRCRCTRTPAKAPPTSSSNVQQKSMNPIVGSQAKLQNNLTSSPKIYDFKTYTATPPTPTPAPNQNNKQSTPLTSKPIARTMSGSAVDKSRRLILVNPIVAQHLKHGGMVNIRSVDGQKSFKVCLPPSASSSSKLDRKIGLGRGMGGVEMVRSLATSTF